MQMSDFSYALAAGCAAQKLSLMGGREQSASLLSLGPVTNWTRISLRWSKNCRAWPLHEHSVCDWRLPLELRAIIIQERGDGQV
jgi:hypothetical protein